MSCDTSGGLLIFYYIKVARNIIFIIAPIILLVLGTIDFLKIVTSSSEKDMGNFINTFKKRILICIVILLLPVFVSLVMSFTTDSSNINCMEKATKENIEALEKKEKAEKQRKMEEEKKKQEEKTKKMNEEEKKKAEEAKKKAEEEKKNNSGRSNVNVSLTAVDVTSIGCPVYYGGAQLSSLTFNSSVASEIRGILTGVCGYVNSTSFLYKIDTAGAYVNKNGYHGRGLAIDLYNTWTYTRNGVTYTPYSGQGTSTWNNYQKFICNVCGGQENCTYNITYQIYMRYFRSKGWCWGGSWVPGYFDPMHFEKTDGGCGSVPVGRIHC